jgi:5,10-methylene-tetrahydrofolate dehydrogenase/methenyl tetrahydrofolate cyclohydrolase
MPLDSSSTIDEMKVTDRVDPDKDVDGLGTVNQENMKKEIK